MCGFTVQLVEHRTDIRGGHGFEPVEALIFSGFIRFSCFNWKIYCDDQFFFRFPNVSDQFPKTEWCVEHITEERPTDVSRTSRFYQESEAL